MGGATEDRAAIHRDLGWKKGLTRVHLKSNKGKCRLLTG